MSDAFSVQDLFLGEQQSGLPHVSLSLDPNDLVKIESALQAMVQTCRDGGSTELADYYEVTLRKVRTKIESLEEGD